MDCPKIIFTHREILYKQDHYNKGFSAMISNFRRNASSPLVNIKSVNYLDNILAKQAAKEAGFDEAVMLNHEGYICEGSMSNLFFIKKNVLYTPSVNCGLIPGIVRGAIVDLFSEHTENNTGNNIENYNENGMLKLIEQGKYTLDQLLEADEAFLTNSVMGIMPLVAINNLLLGTGKPGAKTKEIRTKMNLI
jgi:branched-subunit amino acid aminotransferase/4-amino-4-deoxychorismate lyase